MSYTIAKNLVFFPTEIFSLLKNTKRQLRDLSDFCFRYAKLQGAIFDLIHFEYFPTKVPAISARYIKDIGDIQELEQSSLPVDNVYTNGIVGKGSLQPLDFCGEPVIVGQKHCQPEKENLIKQEFVRELVKSFPSFYADEPPPESYNRRADKQLGERFNEFNYSQTNYNNNGNTTYDNEQKTTAKNHTSESAIELLEWDSFAQNHKKNLVPYSKMITPCVENIFLETFVSNEIYLLRSDIFTKLGQKLFYEKEQLKLFIQKMEEQLNSAFTSCSDMAKSSKKTAAALEKVERGGKSSVNISSALSQYKSARELFYASIYKLNELLIEIASNSEKLYYQYTMIITNYCTQIHKLMVIEPKSRDSVLATFNFLSQPKPQCSDMLGLSVAPATGTMQNIVFDFSAIQRRFSIGFWKLETEYRIVNIISTFQKFYISNLKSFNNIPTPAGSEFHKNFAEDNDCYCTDTFSIPFAKVLCSLLKYNSAQNFNTIYEEIVRIIPTNEVPNELVSEYNTVNNMRRPFFYFFNQMPSGIDYIDAGFVGAEMVSQVYNFKPNFEALNDFNNLAELFGVKTADYKARISAITQQTNENDDEKYKKNNIKQNIMDRIVADSDENGKNNLSRAPTQKVSEPLIDCFDDFGQTAVKTDLTQDQLVFNSSVSLQQNLQDDNALEQRQTKYPWEVDSETENLLSKPMEDDNDYYQ